MTDKILQFPDQREVFKKISYKESEDGDLGVGTLDRKIAICRLNDTEFLIETPEGSTVHDRASLAEFLWVASVFIDEQEKHRPLGEMVCCDY